MNARYRQLTITVPMNKHLPRIAGLFALMLLASPAIPSHASDVQPESRPMIEAIIKTLDKARTSAAYRHLDSSANQLDPKTGDHDFLIFISYINGRIAYYCEQLMTTGGEEAVARLPCPKNKGQEIDPESFSINQSSEEKLQSLELELETNLGSFDDMLLKEQERIAATQPAAREGDASHDKVGRSTASSEGGAAGEAAQSKGRGANGSTSSSQTASVQQGQAKQATAQASGSGVGSSRPSNQLPTSGNRPLSADEDDIVARQLREAAEQETDPAVKERLWEEYRKYKSGAL